MEQVNKNIVPFIKRQALILFLLLLVAVFGVLSKNFFTLPNLISIVKQVALYGIISCGMTFVLIGGNFDLTAGALCTLTCCTTVQMHDEFIALIGAWLGPAAGAIAGPIAAILIAILIGFIFGAITGFLVGYLRLTSLIVTLGMQSIISACAKMYTGSKYVTVANQAGTWFRYVGREDILGIPTQIIIYAVLIVIFQFLLSRMVFGHQVKATGGNAMASNYSGINARGTVMKTYLLSGICSAMAGVVLASRGMQAQVGIGDGFEFDVITACILSGTSLLGGSGSVWRALIGVLIMGVLRNGFVMVGLPYYMQWLSQCIIIVVVVWSDIAAQKKVTA